MTDTRPRRRSRKDAKGVLVQSMLVPEVRDMLFQAAQESGLNRSLYLERLLLQVQQDGQLPVLAPQLDIPQESHVTAA